MVIERTFKALLQLIGVCSVIALSTFEIHAQENFQIEGAWVLDSVQVKEVMSGNIVEKTVLPGDDYNLGKSWMLQLTLKDNGNVAYTENGNQTTSYIIYKIKDISENSATLMFYGITDYIEYKVDFFSDKAMLLNYSYTTLYDQQNIDISWKLYYHKSN